MEKILDILNGWAMTAVSSGVLQVKHIIFFIFITSPLFLVIWKLREIISFVNEVKNSRLNELQLLLDNHELSDEVSACIRDEIKRIIGYRMTGFADVAKQKIIFRLLSENRSSMPVDFFKKFRSFLLVRNDVLLFKMGAAFWFENIVYGWFSFQFLFISFWFVFVFFHRGGTIFFGVDLILYLVVVICFFFSIFFAKMIFRPKECRLLKKVLQMQYDNSSE